MTNSQSVWYNEVDKGLIDLIAKIFGKEMKVIFNHKRKNSLDDNKNPYSKLKYPYIKILHLGEAFDNKRYDRGDSVATKDPMTSEVTMSVSAKPYNLNYQIEIVSDKISELNDLTLKWNFSVVDKNNLDVLDKSGIPRNCFMTKTISTQLEEGDQDDRVIFRGVYKYKIRVELDEQQTYTLPMISSVNLQFDK